MQGEGSNMNTQEWKEAANLPWQRQRPGASRRSRWGLCCSVESVKKDFTRSGFLIRHLLSVAFQAVILSFSSRMEADSGTAAVPRSGDMCFPGHTQLSSPAPGPILSGLQRQGPSHTSPRALRFSIMSRFLSTTLSCWLDLWRGSAFLDLYYFKGELCHVSDGKIWINLFFFLISSHSLRERLG